MKCLSDYCDYNLRQVVKDPTRNSNILDLIFTNMGSHYNPPEVIAPLSTSDHNMVIWMAKTQQRFVNIVKKIKFRPTPRHNLQQFGSCLAQYDWSTVLNVENVDEKVEDFTRATNDMINYYFPERTVRMHSDDKFFITTKIKRLLRKRDNAYKQGRMQKFRELRNRVALEIRKAKRHYYVMNIGRLNTNGDARMWWKKVWKLTGKKKSSINLSEQGSDSKLEDKDAANMINTFFADLTNDFPEIQSRWSSYGHSDVLPTVTPESVAKKLLSIQSNKAPGPNDPYLKIIKMFAHSFAIPLANIFNASFVQKVFPKLWKEFYLAPIPKVEPCTNPDEIRPIALTSTISKIQESYVVDWMYDDIESKICKEQDGGVPRSSAVLALVHLLHKWNKALDLSQRVIRIVFLDFRKAFDLIDHNVLLDNCCKIGVRPGLIGWLGSYLSKRMQVTRFGNELSTSCIINGGVPQGSRIGPIAFVVHINGLKAVIKDTESSLINSSNDDNDDDCDDDLTLFMDDTTLSEVINVRDHVSGTQVGSTPNNIMKVMDFATSQKMELNLKKCKEMQLDFRQNRTVIPPLTFNDTTLERVSAFKLLGLWIDDNLKWQTNTDYIIGKAVKRLFLLKILKKFGADKIDMKRFYISAIRPTLEYGAQVWHGGLTKAQSSSIEKVQRRALRIIYSEKDYEKLLLKAEMHTLEQRRNTMCIDLISKMSDPQHKLHHLLPNKLCKVRQRDTRQNGQLFYNYHYRTERFRNSPIVSSIELYNNSIL